MKSRFDPFGAIVEQRQCRLSECLRKARIFRRINRRDAAIALDVSVTTIIGIESGSIHPKPETIRQLADLYQIDAGRIGADVMIKQAEAVIDPTTSTLWLGWMPITYGSTLAPDRVILEAIAGGIRIMRSLPPMAEVELREEEFAVALTLLDLADDALVNDMVRAFRIPWRRTEDTIDSAIARVRTKSLVHRARNLVALRQDGVGELSPR